MPELPDVETCRRYLDATALHQEVDLVRVSAPRLLAGTTPQGLGHALKGHCIGGRTAWFCPRYQNRLTNCNARARHTAQTGA